MLRAAETDVSTGQSESKPPRLEAGDHLDQPTFHRLYEAMPSHFRAELIEGVAIVPSPTHPEHGDIHAVVMGLIWVYRAGTPGVRTYDDTTVLLPPIDEPKPDAIVVIEPACGGQTGVEDRYLLGPPELVIEVAASSASYDLHSKYRMYERLGVGEYVVLVVEDSDVRWFVAERGQFVPVSAGADGIFRSRSFPGLWLDAAAL
ncbi:MAG TPA: Uma2 family endonuclease, partial [Pirellulales bacterium]|nr:Uma2 family endonuclease [Pirellulales bacterium]